MVMNNSNQFLAELKKNNFAGDISINESDLIVYSTDNSIYELKPEGVIFPKNQADIELIISLLKLTKFREIKITARGGGTSTNGQSINIGFIVDYSRHMTKILSIDQSEMTAIVEPGVILDILNKEVEKFGLYFPPNISPSSRATIGGMVNTDACGKGSCQSGRTSDNIDDLTLHIIDYEGEMSAKNCLDSLSHKLIPLLSEAQKHYSSKHLARTLSGYNIEKSLINDNLNLNYLIAGSEGTLALVSKIKVKLKKLPKKKILILFIYQNFNSALRDATNLKKLNPAAIETIDENIVELAKKDLIWSEVKQLIEGDLTQEENKKDQKISINIVEFSYQSDQEFEEHKGFLNKELSENFAKNNQENNSRKFVIIEDKKEINSIWNLRKQGVGLLGAMSGKRRAIPFVEDTMVEAEKLSDYIAEFQNILDKYHVKYGMFGHVDAGCLHVRPALDMRQQSDRELMKKISDEVAELLLKYCGVIWGEHGKGFRGEYSEKFLGKEIVKIFTAIKKVFDPFDQLNFKKIASANHDIEKIDSVPTRGFLDEKINHQIHDDFENILSCNGNAICFNLDKTLAICPSYKVSLDRRFSPKGRAMLFKEWVRNNRNISSIKEEINFKISDFAAKIINFFNKKFSKKTTLETEIYQSFCKCLGCKACDNQCPIKVGIADAKAFFLYHYYAKNFRKIQDYLIANVEKILIIFYRSPNFYNFLTQNKIVKFIVRKFFQIIDIPAISDSCQELNILTKSQKNITKQQQNQTKNREKIFLLSDAYSYCFQSEELINGYKLLEKLGFEVEFSDIFESGKAQHVKGFLASFRKISKRNIVNLAKISEPKIAIDPSLSLIFRDEYVRFNDVKIEVFYLAEFLAEILKKKLIQESAIKFSENIKDKKYPVCRVSIRDRDPGKAGRDSCRVSLSQSDKDKKYYLILHCTEQTSFKNIEKIWLDIFAFFKIDLNILKIGCCGMSGSFGLESENYQDSRKIFNQNWCEVLHNLSINDKNVIMISGSSCKSQINRFSQIKAKNVFIVLNQLLSNY
jgi:FAD/FMN-containing dehydrogenase/Fe-S oxidoreductase